MLVLSAPAIVQAERGKALFQQHCAACHGEAGSGGMGLPLSKPAVMASLTDEYLRKTIRSGRPGRIMPAFGYLADNEVEDIVTYMRTWGEFRVEESGRPVAGDKTVGKPLFEQYCASCHGEDLGGGAEGTGVTFSRNRDMAIMPPALNNRGFLQAASDDMLHYIIRNGRQGTPMPGFAANLDQQQVDDIIAYIRASEAEHQNLLEEGASLTLVYKVGGRFDETVAALRAAIRSNNFRVFPDRYLEQGLTGELAVNKRQISLRFCNFNKLYEALKLEPRLGVILPCTITIIETEAGEVKLIAANVAMLAKLFNNNQLDEVFEHIQDSYDLILDEATL